MVAPAFSFSPFLGQVLFLWFWRGGPYAFGFGGGGMGLCVFRRDDPARF